MDKYIWKGNSVLTPPSNTTLLVTLLAALVTVTGVVLYGKLHSRADYALQQVLPCKGNFRGPVGKWFYEKHTAATMKYSPNRTIWDVIECFGSSSRNYIPYNTTKNWNNYADLLYIHKYAIFGQDGLRFHQTKVVTDFRKKNIIFKLKWHGNSSVLNPIENLGTFMKDKGVD